MDLKLQQFRNYLRNKQKITNQSTLDQYCQTVITLNNWLIEQNKNIGIADERDLRSWLHKRTNPRYRHSLKSYYTFINAKPQLDVLSSLGTSRPLPKEIPLIKQWQFKQCFSEVNCENLQHLVLFNLLWSELNFLDIINLRKSDIDLKKKVITLNGVRYFATAEAWQALEKYMGESSEREKYEPLFRFTSDRQARSLIQKNLGHCTGIGPRHYIRSCKSELQDLGRSQMFVVNTDSFLSEDVHTDQVIAPEGTDLFNVLVQKITDFGALIGKKIGKMGGKSGEKNLQRLLEGYLTAVFPKEKIVSEFTFHGWKESKIDLTVGEIPIPIEVKLHRNKPIGDCQREGFSQVKEFMAHYPQVQKGIIVIGDTHRNLKNKTKFGSLDNVLTIVI